jgi:putative FmdB family regulatory protein
MDEAMALYEYFCESCSSQFEQITSSTDPEAGKCPRCQTKNTRKLISAFRVGGRGDLRETTLHGCHDCHVPLGPQQGAQNQDQGHSHDHAAHSHDGHDHGHSHDE